MGNIWYHKFTRKYYFNNKWDEKNVKVEKILQQKISCDGRTVWKGEEDREKICRNVRKNTAHVTRYSFCRKGGFFDQMPVKAKTGLVPLKKDRPTEIYGGYNKSTATFFVLVRFQTDKKRDIIFMPVELLVSKKFLEDEAFAHEYAKKTIEGIVGKKVLSTEFLLNKRPLKVQTMLSLDGFPVIVTGKASGGTKLLITAFASFLTDWEWEKYIYNLETFNKKRVAENLSHSKKEEDAITKEKNLQLYDLYTEKISCNPYNKRPNNPIEILKQGREKFENLEKIEDQIEVLLQIQGLFGRVRTGDLIKIGGSKLTGNTALSSQLSNWKKNYTDVRIIDQSASGIYETYSENLLDLL
jgi:CRISPR-associated endonuclease Csn1